jgi:hypothetical protein
MNFIQIFQISNEFDGVAPINTITLKENIIQIGSFMNDLIYAFDETNTITLVNDNKYKKDNDQYGYNDKLSINARNANMIKEKEQENYKILLHYKMILSAKKGAIFMYNKNNILYAKSLTLTEGITKIYNTICDEHTKENYSFLFNLGIDIYNKQHVLWTIEDIKKFQTLYINCSQSLLSSLLIELNENNDKNEFKKIIDRCNELISFLFEIGLVDYIINEKNNLLPIFTNIDIIYEDLFFYLLEPYVIEDKFLNIANMPISFIKNLMDNYLKKKNKNSQFTKNNKSWLSELLVHFNIKNFLEKGKNNVLLETIKENDLINTIIYFILNYNYDEVMINNSINYCTPLDLLLKLFKYKTDKKQKAKNNPEKKEDNSLEIDLNNDELFKSENRYKDEIIFSAEYLRIKIIWYIYSVLKNKIIIDSKEKSEDEKNHYLFRIYLKS